MMNKIKTNKLLFLFSSSLAIIITTILPSTTGISQLPMIYSENEVTDGNIGKFFAAPGLSIQQANSGEISKINSTSYLLELKEVADKTITLTDRPDRIVKSTSTSDFIVNWSTLMGAHSTYEEVPPNAALIFDNQNGIQETIIIELYNPVYNIDSKILNYNFIILDNSTLDNLPRDIKHSALLIDGL